MIGKWIATTEPCVYFYHLRPVRSLRFYDPSQLDLELQGTVQDDPDTLWMILFSMRPRNALPTRLSNREFNQLMSFLEALSSPTLSQLNQVVPRDVPSGLPVDVPEGFED